MKTSEFTRGFLCAIFVCIAIVLSYGVAVSVQAKPAEITVAEFLSPPFIMIGSFDINIVPNSTYAEIGCYWANALSVCDGFGYQQISQADANTLLHGGTVYVKMVNDTPGWPTYQWYLLRQTQPTKSVPKYPNDHVWTTWLEGTKAPPFVIAQTVLFYMLILALGSVLAAITIIHARYKMKVIGKHETD